jgi:polyribonucleotide nucleotidyltransferase
VIFFFVIRLNYQKELPCDYRFTIKRQYAQGVIPATYMRREGAAKETELLCRCIIDRPIRPLFPHGFYHEVQIFLSYDFVEFLKLTQSLQIIGKFKS